MKQKRNIGRRILCVMFFTSLLLSNVATFAQKPKGSTQALTKAPAGAKCSGAWTGSIKYTRTQSASNRKTVDRVSGRGKDTTNFEMGANYNASVAVIESPEKNGTSIGKATINHKMTSTETVEAVESNSCDRGKSWKRMSGTSVSKTEMSGDGSSVDANVNVGVNSDGTYSVSVGLPQIKGKVQGSQSSTFSGQCTPKEGKTNNLPPTETSIDGGSLTSSGKDRINDGAPNKISGSFSQTIPGGVTETITWNLQKCGAPLRITDLKFEDMKFPTWNDWREITEQVGTIDGNLVKIKAKVLNASGETKSATLSFKETFKGDKWDGAKPDMPLGSDITYFSLDPGEERDIEFMWNTSGYAWFDDGRPTLVQRVKAEIWENNKKIDDMTQNLKIAPRPVVLVHGLWSDWKRFETWQNILTTSHSYDWKAFAVGEKPEHGVLNTGGKFLSDTVANSVAENASQLKSYVEYAQKDRNAWHVDIVAHSTGGLIARNYIGQLMPASSDGLPLVTHLVMLGTPNLGSPCADVMYLFSGTKALYQATQDFANGFNRLNKERKGVRFSSLAGDPLPTMCKKIEWNDGFVSVSSAKWTVADTATSKNIHTDLASTSDFSDFVKPRLAIGPKGDHRPDVPTQGFYDGKLSERHYGAMFEAGPFASVESPFSDTAFTKDLKLAAKQSVEIEIPVETAVNFGLTFMADTNVSATLFDDKIMIVGQNLAKTPESGGWFRSIFFGKPTTSGTWKLKFENTGDVEYRVLLTTWANASK